MICVNGRSEHRSSPPHPVSQARWTFDLVTHLFLLWLSESGCQEVDLEYSKFLSRLDTGCDMRRWWLEWSKARKNVGKGYDGFGESIDDFTCFKECGMWRVNLDTKYVVPEKWVKLKSIAVQVLTANLEGKRLSQGAEYGHQRLQGE